MLLRYSFILQQTAWSPTVGPHQVRGYPSSMKTSLTEPILYTMINIMIFHLRPIICPNFPESFRLWRAFIFYPSPMTCFQSLFVTKFLFQLLHDLLGVLNRYTMSCNSIIGLLFVLEVLLILSNRMCVFVYLFCPNLNQRVYLSQTVGDCMGHFR